MVTHRPSVHMPCDAARLTAGGANEGIEGGVAGGAGGGSVQQPRQASGCISMLPGVVRQPKSPVVSANSAQPTERNAVQLMEPPLRRRRDTGHGWHRRAVGGAGAMGEGVRGAECNEGATRCDEVQRRETRCGEVRRGATRCGEERRGEERAGRGCGEGEGGLAGGCAAASDLETASRTSANGNADRTTAAAAAAADGSAAAGVRRGTVGTAGPSAAAAEAACWYNIPSMPLGRACRLRRDS